MSKSILEEALLQVSQLEEAVKNNAQEILASTMKEEIDELVRESMEETQDEEVAEEVSEETDMAMEEESTEEVELDEQIEDADDEEEESDEDADEDEGEDMPEEDEAPMEDLDSDLEDIEMPSLELPSLEDIEDMADEMGDDDEDEVIDLTGASDEEILKVFKAMGEEDGIIVAKDEDGTIHLEDGEDEYRIEMDSEEPAMEMVSEEASEEEEVSESDEEEAEVVYEIEIDEEVSEEEEMVSEEEEVAEEVTESEEEVEESEEDAEEEVEGDVDEAARTLAADARKPADQGMKYKAGRKDLSEDVQTLQAKNAELTEALKLFRDKLNEVGVFNSNLAYATRLFTEHTTTKQEKLNILKRFDSVESLKESKTLYNTIKDELAASNEKLNENVANKISNSPQSGSSEKLVESKAYENPQVRRIKEMMGILK